MVNRGTALVAVLLAVAIVRPAAGQVSAPRMVDENEPPEETPSEPPPLKPPPASVVPQKPPPPQRPDSGEKAPPVPAAPVAALPLPAPPPPPPVENLPPKILPVAMTPEKLLALWAERRNAVREGDPLAIERSGTALLNAKRELGVDDLFAMAVAEVRESRKALSQNGTLRALNHAQFAVDLAPDLPEAHMALALSEFEDSPRNVLPVVFSLAAAARAAAADPQTSRALLGDLWGALFLGAFLAAMVLVVMILLRHLRMFLHDVHHLPFVGAAGIQATILALVVLALPPVLGAGPFLIVAVATLVSFPYQSARERLVTLTAVVLLAVLPFLAGECAKRIWWTGTLAERIERLERDEPHDGEAQALAKIADGAPAPAVLYAALGRYEKRLGRLSEAKRFYRLAEDADPHLPELSVNEGNVLFLEGDLEGAKAAYLAATDRAPNDLTVLAAAHYDLSKLYLRTAEKEKSAVARERAEHEDPIFLRKYGSDDDFAANRYMVDIPVRPFRLAQAAQAAADVEAVHSWAEAEVAGALPGAWLIPAAGVLVLLLGLLALVSGGLAPARACQRCGGPACRRCDNHATGLCGPCINVFIRRGVVDARDRLRKESEVFRHRRFMTLSTRILSVLGGGLGPLWSGRPFLGAFLVGGSAFLTAAVLLWRGLLPPPFPTPHVLALKLVAVVPLAAVLWGIAVRDAFRRTE